MKNYLESTFIKVTNLSNTNIIVGCIYRHATMDLNEFNCYYLNALLEKLAKEQKTVFLLGDFNVKHEQHKATNEFLDYLSSYKFLLILSNQLELTPIQSLLLTIFFPIISLRK